MRVNDIMIKKVAVLGATGMAGHVISLLLRENGYDVYGMSRSIETSEKNKRLDVTDFEGLTKWIDSIEPDIIVNAIGLLQKISAERPDLSILVNSYLPHMLEYRFKTSKIIHLSTDCVFSGKNAPYTEDSFPDGDTMYDRTKSLGELNNSKDLTFRMSIIGPDISPDGTGLLNWFFKQTGDINGYSKAFWNGVTTIELAKAIDCAIKQDLKGLYHLTPKQNIDKYNLLLLFQKEFSKKDVNIIPFDGFSIDKTLINTRTDFDYNLPPYPEMIKEMSNWTKRYKDLYWFI